MSSANVEPEELEAILEPDSGDGRLGAVDTAPSARNFQHPRRLSAARLTELRASVLGVLPALQSALEAILARACTVELIDVVEVGCDGLFDDQPPPLCVSRFDVDGQPAWVAWNNSAAVAALEAVLGAAEPAETETRPLSSIESALLGRLLAAAGESVARGLGLEASGFRLVLDPDDVGSWREGGEDADPGRVVVQIAFQGPGEPSSIRVYLPGLSEPGERRRTETLEGPLPVHTREVLMALRAVLGSADIPLNQVLGLEEGDVIPLELPVGSPLRVNVEGWPCATARLGSHRGRLALQIENWVPGNEAGAGSGAEGETR